MFNLINYPTLIVELPYNNCKSIKEAHIRLLSTIEDNSDIPERIFAGEFTRFTLQILYRIATYYLQYLKKINKETDRTELKLQKELKNEELIKLLALENTMDYVGQVAKEGK